MPGKLVSLTKSGHEKLTFPVVSLSVFIGSDSYCDIRIRHKDVSPQHCLITAQKDKPTLIRNLSRTSPTLVNGAEIGSKDVELVDQDIITICSRQFRWKSDDLSMASDEYSTSLVKGRKSWPVIRNRPVAVVTPHRRDEDLPLKKRRTTYGPDNFNASSKKGRVLGIKSGVKGKKTNIKKSSLKAIQSLNVKRKSVKFAVTPHDHRLGKRSKIALGPPTPYRPSTTPGRKASLYLTPPSGMGSSKTPTKGILKTPGRLSRNGNQSTSKLEFSDQLTNLDRTPPAHPLLLSSTTEPIIEESSLRTPPKDESDLPEIVMRSSKRSSLRRERTLSPESTPKSSSKVKIRRQVSDDESFEASERAAKKLKLNPPAAIDKKKIAAIMQCHRKSLTPHPITNRKRCALISSPMPSLGTPKSIKKSAKLRKSEPIQYSSIVPKALQFGSFRNTEPKPSLIRKKKKTFKPIKLEKKYPMGVSSVAKMLSSPSPPGRKITRATRAARASREQVQKGEAIDVLSALDLSRKWPTESKSELSDASQIPTSPIADTSASGIKELFSTEKTVDVRELFLEGGTEKSPKISSLSSTSVSTGKKSRQSSMLKGSETLFNSQNSFNFDGVQELPTSPSVFSSQKSRSMSRRSLTLKGIKSPSLPNSLLNTESVKSPGPKKRISFSQDSISASEVNEQSVYEESSFNFSLGSFNSSKCKTRGSNLLSPLSSEENYQTPIEKMTPKKMSTTFKSSILSSKKKSRASLRRVALSTSTTKALNMSVQDFQTIGKIASPDLPEDSSDHTLPLKKRSLKTVLNSSLKSRQSRRLIKIETTVNSTVSLTSPNKSKVQTSIMSASSSRKSLSKNISKDFVEDSPLSNASTRVHIGSSTKSVDLSSSSSSDSVSNFNTRSESINVENPCSPSLSPTKSTSTGKRKNIEKNKEFNSSLINSTRSRSSVNIDLFSLDKLPLGIPSSTPLRSKPVKKMFKEETPIKKYFNSKDKKSLIDSNSLKNTFKKSHKSFDVKKSLSTSGLYRPSSPKSFRDALGTSDKRDQSVDNLISKTLRSNVNSSKLNNKTNQINESFEYSVNKSTRSKTPIIIDLFKLDDNPLYSSSNKRGRKSAEVVNRKSELSKLMNSSSLMNKTDKPYTSIETSWNKSSMKSGTFSSIGIHNSTLQFKSERTRTPVETSWNKSSIKSGTFSSIGIHNSTLQFKSERTRTPVETSWNKSTLSKSSVNLDLFKLDDKPSEDCERYSLNDVVLRNTPSDRVFKNVKINSSTKSQVERSRKSSVPISSINFDFSDISNKCSPGKKMLRSKSVNSNVSEIFNESLMDMSKTRSTRSKSSVNIDLFKLDDKSPKYRESKAMNEILSVGESSDIVSKKPKISRSSVSISSLDLNPSKLDCKFSPENKFLKRSKSSEVIDKKSVFRSDVLEILNSKSSADASKTRSTRSKSLVNLDLFKLSDNLFKSSSKKLIKEKLSRSELSYSISRKPILSSSSNSEKGRLRKNSVPISSLDVNLSKLDKVSPKKNLKRSKLSEVIDRKSLSISNVPESLDESIMGISKTRPSQNKSSINLSKLDDKPSESSLIKRSSRSKSAEFFPINSDILPENETGCLLETSNSSALSRGEKHSEISISKSFRNRSLVHDSNSVNERSSGPVMKSPFGEMSFEKQQNDAELSSRGRSDSMTSFKTYNKSRKAFSEISSSEKEHPKKETRSRSTVSIDLFKMNEKPSESRNLVDKSSRNSNNSVFETSLLDLSTQKSTRRTSSINNDVLKKCQTPSHENSIKEKRLKNKSSDASPQINSSLIESKHLSKSFNGVNHINDSPSKFSNSSQLTNKKKCHTSNSGLNISTSSSISNRRKHSSNVNILKFDGINSDSLEHSFYNCETNDTNSFDSPDKGTLLFPSPKRESLRKKSNPLSTIKSPSSEFVEPRFIGKEISFSGDTSFDNRSTRSTSTFDLSYKNESPRPRNINTPKQNKMSSLTPSLKQLTLKSSKKVSISTSPLKLLRSPRLRLSRVTESFIKNSRKVTPKTFVSTYTQTSTIKKKNQLGLFKNYQKVDVAINTTPICDYEQIKSLLSPRAKRSLRQKEFDESQRTSGSSINGGTPLSAISPKGRLSLSVKHTPNVRKHNIQKVSIGGNRADTKKKVESSRVKSMKLACSEEETENLENNSKMLIKKVQEPLHDTLNKTVDIIKLSHTKESPEDQAIPLQVSYIDSCVKSHQKTEDILKTINAPSSIDLPKRMIKDTSSPLIILESPKILSKMVLRKRNYERPPKVVALKISAKSNKVLSSTIIKNSPVLLRKNKKSSVNLTVTKNNKREVKSTKMAKYTRRNLSSPLVQDKKEKKSKISPEVRSKERSADTSKPVQIKTQKFVSFQGPLKEISSSEVVKHQRKATEFVKTLEKVSPTPSKRGRYPALSIGSKKETFSPEPVKRGRRAHPVVKHLIDVSVPKPVKQGMKEKYEPANPELSLEPPKRGRRAALIEPLLEISVPKPAKQEMKKKRGPAKLELSPEPPKHGRGATLIEPPFEISVPKTFKQVKRGKTIPAKLKLSPEPPKRGRRAALIEPPEISVLKPAKQEMKKKCWPAKLELSPEPPKRGRRAALIEPPFEISVPKTFNQVKRGKHVPEKLELSPEPPKRGRRAALIDQPFEILVSNPPKKGKKEELPLSPKHGRCSASVDSPKEVSDPKSVKRVMKEKPVPAKNKLSQKLTKHGRRAAAIVEPPVDISDLKQSKKDKSIVIKEDSKESVKTEPAKRGRRKAIIEEPPIEILAQKPPKRGRHAVLESSTKENLKSESLKCESQPTGSLLLEDVNKPAPTKRRRAAVGESFDIVSKPLKRGKQTKEVSPEFFKQGKAAISVGDLKVPSEPPRRGRHAQSNALLSNKITEKVLQNEVTKDSVFRNKRGINLIIEENKKKPNLKTAMKPIKSNISSKIKKLSKAQSLLKAIKTEKPS